MPTLSGCNKYEKTYRRNVYIAYTSFSYRVHSSFLKPFICKVVPAKTNVAFLQTIFDKKEIKLADCNIYDQTDEMS